jgi:hypothetical protein
MQKGPTMRLFFTCCLMLLGAQNTEARWSVQSEFQLHLSEPTFDKVIEDFWQSLQGKQNIPLENISIAPGGIPIQIQGIRTELNYAFPLPQRIEGAREWAMATDKLSATLIVDRISASQIIEREIDGIIIEIRLDAECRNIRLKLPEGSASISAHIRAEVAQSQVKLSLPFFDADWREGSWQLESMSCSGAEGFDSIVAQEALKALSSFQKFDTEVRTALDTSFEQWSKDASLLLLSQRELPSEKDYVKIFYEPESAVETGGGLLLRGEMRFEYPFVAPGQDIENKFRISQTRIANEFRDNAKPMLLLPFETVRALMMGEYFANKLEYSMWSNEIESFNELMQSRWSQFFAWPHLMSWPKNTKFAFQFQPMGPPSFENERAAGSDAISGNINLPLAVRMYGPIKGVYSPMVEFRTQLLGNSTIKLLPNGKVQFQVETEELPVAYGWSKKYLNKYKPTQRIAVKTMAKALKKTLNAEGFTISLPTITVGKSLKLKPESWQLDGKRLRLDFDASK